MKQFPKLRFAGLPRTRPKRTSDLGWLIDNPKKPKGAREKEPLSHRRRPPQGCERRAASLGSSSSLRALAPGSGMRRARGCSGPGMERGQPNEETESRRSSARPLRRIDEHHHREARGWSAPLEEALGPQEMPRRREPDESGHGSHLSRNQRACARYVAPHSEAIRAG